MGFRYDPKRQDRILSQKVEQLLKAKDKNGCLRITQMGEKVLRKSCDEYRGGLDPELLRRLIAAMKTTMQEAPGVGLAAPQIDLGVKIAVIEDVSVDKDYDPILEDDIRETYHTPFYVIINPTYEALPDDGDEISETLFYEGCLSFANFYAARYRYYKINAKWTDEKGRDHEEAMQGWPARIFQHETDHLSGEIYIDKAIVRSLATAENLGKYELDDDIERTAKEFNFSL